MFYLQNTLISADVYAPDKTNLHSIKTKKDFFFIFSYLYLEKISFWRKFSKLRFWWIYTFWGLLSPKTTFLAFSMCVSVSLCLSVISITQKQIKAETSNLVFNISIIYRCYLKLFIKIGQKLCVQGHTKEF